MKFLHCVGRISSLALLTAGLGCGNGGGDNSTTGTEKSGALSFQAGYEYQLIPAYFDDQASKDALSASSQASNGGIRGAVIANFGDPGGPGTGPDSSNQAWLSGLQANGVPVIGYVDNPFPLDSFYQRSAYDIIQEIQNWIAWYGVDGIFFDDSQRTSAQATQSDIARTFFWETYVQRHISSPRAPWGYLEAFNWGQTDSLEQYVYCSRNNAPRGSLLFSTFEGEEGTFRSTTFPSWVNAYGADRFFQLIYKAAYDGSSLTNLSDDMHRSRQAGAGWIYVTEGTVEQNPWHLLVGHYASPILSGAWDAERAITNGGPYGDYTCCTSGGTYTCPISGLGVLNGDFASDLKTGLNNWLSIGWSTAGIQQPAIAVDSVTGSRVGLLGSSSPYNGDSTLLQTVTVPFNAHLTFSYRPFCPDTITYDQLQMQVLDENGAVLATPLNVCDNSGTWSMVTQDLSPWNGKTIILRFNVHDDGYPTDPSYMYIDNVTVQ